MSPRPEGAGRATGSKLHSRVASEPPDAWSASVARALAIVASILARLRTIPASPSSLVTSSEPKAATAAGTKPWNAARNASRLRRIVSHDSPAWNPSRQSFSKMRPSSVTGRPHSSSW